jgi:hypothetical protein
MRFLRQLFYILGIFKEPTLIGVWERIGDDFAGCRLRIEFDGPNLNGRIVRLPDHMEKYGWHHDDAKWIQIQKQAVCRYRLLELYKVISSQSAPARNLYYQSRLLVQSNNDIMIIPPDGSGGRKNRWRRINNRPKNQPLSEDKNFNTPTYPPISNRQKHASL